MRSYFFALILQVLLVSANAALPFFGESKCRIGSVVFERLDAGPVYISTDEQGQFVIAGSESKLLVSNPNTGSFSSEGRLTILGDIHTKHLSSNGMPQWKLVHMDTFDKDDGTWDPSGFTTCGASTNLFLGGHCKFAGIETSRLYEHLPPHEYVRITANVHFIDQWTGQSVYMKGDGVIRYAGTLIHYILSTLAFHALIPAVSHKWCPAALSMSCTKFGIDVCGRQYPDSLSKSLDVQFRHTGGTLGVLLGSTMDKNVDPCKASWGVDNVGIYVR